MKKGVRKQDTTRFRNEKEEENAGAKKGRKREKPALSSLTLIPIIPVIFMSNSVQNRYTNEEKSVKKAGKLLFFK
ncbi:hypothetical protein [Bacillus sp. ISL-55]|uniref:hypothetical protein n=1 Tax=Bacillus sp. ISL-55 TaxID=2819134 RepID=UPI001BEB0002|nr:hypothetical protein [Bacillus sp. ISL-55]